MSWDALIDSELSGEGIQEAGRTGAERAKVWLEATTRANVHWVNPKNARKLKFKWADTGGFSFDIGGVLRGDDFDGNEFFAESKYYQKAHDQTKHYKKYMAQCYRALMVSPNRCDIFMWITWSPFMVTRWNEIRSTDFIKECVDEFHLKVFGEELREGASRVDPKVCQVISERVWLIVLSAEQEKLVPTYGGQKAIEQYFLRSRRNGRL